MDAGLATDGWKRTLEHYHASAAALVGSMADFYDYRYPIVLDRKGELRNGAHRVACALVLGLDVAPCVHVDEDIVASGFPPAWDADWFRANGMKSADLNALVRYFEALRRDSDS